jgi:hypothetical protein
MKLGSKLPAKKIPSVTRIVVNPKDARMATVTHNRKVIFTIKTDVSGVNPSIIVVATETRLKSMEKGKTGIVLWNGSPEFDPRHQR